MNELEATKTKLFDYLKNYFDNKQKYFLKMYFSLGDCRDDVLIKYVMESGYSKSELLEFIKSYENHLFNEFDLNLSENHLNLIKKYYSILNYSKTEIIQFLLDKNIFSMAELLELLKN